MMFLTGASKSSASSQKESSKKGDPAELAKEWKRNLQKEVRKMDRDILNIKRQEDRATKECQKLAKSNQISAARILAKEIVRTRKTVERMYTTKAQLNSVANSLQTSVCKFFSVVSYLIRLIFNATAMMKLSGCMAKSTEIMTAMNG
jgi:SRSO17 transposase